MAGLHTLKLIHTHTIALPKDLTCGLESTTRSVPTSPSIRPPDNRYRLSVVEERGEARAAQSSASGRWFFWVHHPTNVPKYSPLHSLLPILARAMSKFTQQVLRYVPGPAGRNYLTTPQRSGTAPPGLQPWERALIVNQQDQREC